MEWVLQLPVLFFSVVIHEFSHGVVAYEKGDDTAERAGRLTLNPMSHVDAFGTIFLPVFCMLVNAPVFGWAKPVPVDTSRLKDPRRDSIKVAFAGPASNVTLAFVAAVAFKLVKTTALLSAGMRQTVLHTLLFAVTINLFLALFNLLPIFPLDGSRVLGGLLPPRARAVYLRHAPYGMIILLFVLLTSGLNTLVVLPLKVILALWYKVGLLG
ncbi:MAG: site-2 protease family protein [Elusimicrobia bacterium]|nr:site-2 protease family protein [Elusimicrobiota bacterium]